MIAGPGKPVFIPYKSLICKYLRGLEAAVYSPQNRPSATICVGIMAGVPFDSALCAFSCLCLFFRNLWTRLTVFDRKRLLTEKESVCCLLQPIDAPDPGGRARRPATKQYL